MFCRLLADEWAPLNGIRIRPMTDRAGRMAPGGWRILPAPCRARMPGKRKTGRIILEKRFRCAGKALHVARESSWTAVGAWIVESRRDVCALPLHRASRRV